MKEKISKLVIKPSEITAGRCFGLASNENLLLCPDCKSPIVYVQIQYGVVAEDHEYMVQYNRGERVYALREVGFRIYCAECGDFIENYCKYFYPEDQLVFYTFDLDELGSDERAEMEVCLHQFNQRGEYTPRYKSNIFINLKKSLEDYEKKHPVVTQNKKKSRRKNLRNVKNRA